MKAVKESAFGARLREAFKGASNAEIAKVLEVGASTVTDYMRGGTFPTAEGLLRIARITKCNLHYLLTGEGEVSADPYRLVDETTRLVLENLGKDEDKTTDEIVNLLLREALSRRAARYLSDYPDIDPDEVDQMRLLLKMFDGELQEEELATSSTTSSATSRRRRR